MATLIERLARPSPALGAFYMTITALCWGGNFVLGRWAAGLIPPLTLSCIRWSLATLVILPLAAPYLKRDWPVMRAQWLLLLIFGLTGTGYFNALQYLGLNYTTAINAAVMNSSAPVLIVIAGYLLYGDRVGLAQVSGITVSLAGVLCVIGRGSLSDLVALGFNRGDLLILTAMVIASVYAASMRRRPSIHAMSFAFVTFAVAAVVNMPLMAGELATGKAITWTPATIAAMGYVSVIAAAFAYLCFNRGIEILGGARAGVFLHLIPVFTSLLAMVFLGEQPRLYHAVGFGLILGGIWLTTRK